MFAFLTVTDAETELYRDTFSVANIDLQMEKDYYYCVTGNIQKELSSAIRESYS